MLIQAIKSWRRLKYRNRYPVHQIKEALNKANVVELEQGIYISIDKSPLLEEIFNKHKINIFNDYIRLEDLRTTLKKIKS